MAVGVLQEFETTVENYDAVNEKLDPASNPPQGLMLHCGSEIGGGKMRVFDVWESKEAFEKFAQERLGPAVAEVMGEGTEPTKLEVHELHDLVQP
jgi:hypothetical protein